MPRGLHRRTVDLRGTCRSRHLRLGARELVIVGGALAGIVGAKGIHNREEEGFAGRNRAGTSDRAAPQGTGEEPDRTGLSHRAVSPRRVEEGIVLLWCLHGPLPPAGAPLA